MPEAVIVSGARTPIGRAFRGAFNHDARRDDGRSRDQARRRARRRRPARSRGRHPRRRPARRRDRHNLGRNAALRAGLPITRPRHDDQPLLRSGLQAIATAAAASSPTARRSSSPAACESISSCRTT
jgi:acetyl-CoA C-acetyltransferase